MAAAAAENRGWHRAGVQGVADSQLVSLAGMLKQAFISAMALLQAERHGAGAGAAVRGG